jgi:hypothetical protein
VKANLDPSVVGMVGHTEDFHAPVAMRDEEIATVKRLEGALRVHIFPQSAGLTA